MSLPLLSQVLDTGPYTLRTHSSLWSPTTMALGWVSGIKQVIVPLVLNLSPPRVLNSNILY